MQFLPSIQVKNLVQSVERNFHGKISWITDPKKDRESLNSIIYKYEPESSTFVLKNGFLLMRAKGKSLQCAKDKYL